MFTFSKTSEELRNKVLAFMEEHIYPNEQRFYAEAEALGPWKVFPVVEELKPKARAAGLWNLFMPDTVHGVGLNSSTTGKTFHGPSASASA